jgi:hypothetical protein
LTGSIVVDILPSITIAANFYKLCWLCPVLQVVPAGLVKRMATKRYRLSDEDEEQDDDEAFAQVC